MDGRLRLVQVLHEGDDAALVKKLVRLLVALVVDRDVDAAIQERELAQALREDVEAERRGLEDERIRLEGDLGAALIGDAGFLDRRFRIAAVVALEVHLAVSSHFHLKRLGERVHH